MELHSIKFAIEVDARLIDPDRGHVAAVTGHKVLDWSTGMGPCGRWVGRLQAEIDMATVRVTQTSYSTDRSKELTELLELDRMATHGRPSNLGHLYDLYDLSSELSADCKIETFIYKLEDVRGRIKAVERQGR